MIYIGRHYASQFPYFIILVLLSELVIIRLLSFDPTVSIIATLIDLHLFVNAQDLTVLPPEFVSITLPDLLQIADDCYFLLGFLFCNLDFLDIDLFHTGHRTTFFHHINFSSPL